MKRKYSRLAWLAALTLIVAACGDGDAEEEATTTPTEATETTEATEATEATETTEAAEEPGEILTDVGVDDTSIKVGLLADLTGIFSPLVQDIVAAQEAYWSVGPGADGVAGRQIELVTADTSYDIDQHIEQYEAIRDEVVMLGQSTGSPHTSRLVQSGLLEEDDMATIALTWYSGWADPAFDGGFVLEKGTNYCLEAMNVVAYLSDKFVEENGRAAKWAVVSFPGEYGQDGATGAKLAIEALGADTATLDFDGEALVTPPGDDPETEVIQGITKGTPDPGDDPDFVWTTVNPTNLAVIMGGAAQGGYQGGWTGSVPSYDFRLLDSPVAELLSASYYQTAYSVPWGTDVDGMQEVIDAMLEFAPDRRPSDAFIIGWQEAMITHAVLEEAAANGDMTRAGVVAAANTLEGIDFGGLAPAQTYAGTPDEHVTREIALFRPDKAAYDEAGGAEQTIGTAPDGGTTGSVLAEDFFIHDIVEAYEFDSPCFTG